MRPPALLLAAAAIALVRTDALAGEPAARVAPLFARMRAAPPSFAPAAREPRRLYVVVRTLTAEGRAALEAAGLTIELPPPGEPAPPWPGGEVVQGFAGPEAEAAVRRLPFVVRVERPGEPWTNVGAVTTAGDAILRGEAARTASGSDGTGVSVGVISDGVDDRAASVATADLPDDVVITGGDAGAGDEGTAMLEIVHDLAPGAHLIFAAPRTSVEMVSAIDALAAAGAHVIVDDLVFTDEPKFEDGPIALAARRFTEGGGIYVTAAGNFARSHYFAAYRRTTGRGIGGVAYGGVHAFDSGDFGNSIRIPPGAEVLVVLQWNDRFGAAANDLDVLLVRPGPGEDTILAGSVEPQDGDDAPYEALRWANTTGGPVDAYIAIGDYAIVSDPASLRLNLVIFSRVTVTPEHLVRRESVFGHAAVEEVLSVAAADAARPDDLETFSSEGPASIFFPVRATRQVPRLTAVDGVETAVGRRGSFTNPFRGTSAAAPHVAGCAALLLGAGAPASGAVAAMLATAFDLGAGGVDVAAGAGRLDCAAAMALALGRATAPVIGSAVATFDPTGAVQVELRGEDAEGDARAASVRLLAVDGAELAAESLSVAAGGLTFGAGAVFRAAALAEARVLSAVVTDAVGLRSAEAQTLLVCPADASLGDALCVLGDLIGRLVSVPGRAGRRLERRARAAATALTRAGSLRAGGRERAATRALRQAAARVRGLERAVRRGRVDPGLKDSFVADAAGLRARLLALRNLHAGVTRR